MGFDFLGAAVYYCREVRTLRLSAEESTPTRLRGDSGIKLGKPRNPPNFDESAPLEEGAKIAAGCPYREAPGALLWVAFTARPDVSAPVAALAREVPKSTPLRMAKAASKVLR